jgi:CGNR zinc finger protein/putative stress-induced transcription regulator
VSHVGPADPGVVALRPRRSLSDLLWLANTRHGPAGHWFARVSRDDGDHDHLETDRDAVMYLVDHRLALPGEAVSARHLAALVEIREMVRGLLDPAAGWTPGVRAILERTRFRIAEDTGLAAAGSGWDAFIGDLMVPLVEVVEQRSRLRICGNPHCRLMFLDGSKNQARRWCDNGGCGNRDRVRRYRSRPSAAAATGAT